MVHTSSNETVHVVQIQDFKLVARKGSVRPDFYLE